MKCRWKCLGTTTFAIALAGCQTEEPRPPVSAQVAAIAQTIASKVSANPRPGAGVSVQSAQAEGKLVRISVRVPENDPGLDFFHVDGRQTEVINALEAVVCDVQDIDLFLNANGVVQAYIDDVDGDRIAVVFPSNCRPPG